jgi:phosphatidylglycerophosphatase A
MTRFIATFGYIGLIPFAAGTWGSLAALPVGYLLHRLGGPLLLGAAALLLYQAGFWATRIETFGKLELDPSDIVVDEVVGQWIALLPLSFGLWHAGVPSHVFPWPGWITAFLLFRLFDIWKPWPVSWADRQRGPRGVMLDDVVAGLMAAAGVAVLGALAHGIPA